MKRISIAIFVLSFFYCNAQDPIVIHLEEWDGEERNNVYYKDANNVLDTFEGTWLYTNGNTSLRMVLEKKTMFFNGDFYQDLLIGEYQYIENGIEKINTLDQLNILEGEDHHIFGDNIYRTCDYLPSNDCVEGEVRLKSLLFDPNKPNHGAVAFLQRRNVNNQEALNAYIIFSYSTEGPSSGSAPDPNMPWQQEYLLIKQ